MAISGLVMTSIKIVFIYTKLTVEAFFSGGCGWGGGANPLTDQLEISANFRIT